MINTGNSSYYRAVVNDEKLSNNSNYMFKNGDIVAVNSNAILSNDVKENLDMIGNVELYIDKDDSSTDITYVAGRKIKDDGTVHDFVLDKNEYLIKFYPTDLKLIEHGKLDYVPDVEYILVRNMYVSKYKLQDGYKIGKVVIESDYFPSRKKGSKIIYNISDAISIKIDGVEYHQVDVDDIIGTIS